ncbi:hypothetical protein BS78_01G113900, partial [Paspalum vaginatum]
GRKLTQKRGRGRSVGAPAPLSVRLCLPSSANEPEADTASSAAALANGWSTGPLRLRRQSQHGALGRGQARRRRREQGPPPRLGRRGPPARGLHRLANPVAARGCGRGVHRHPDADAEEPPRRGMNKVHVGPTRVRRRHGPLDGDRPAYKENGGERHQGEQSRPKQHYKQPSPLGDRRWAPATCHVHSSQIRS